MNSSQIKPPSRAKIYLVRHGETKWSRSKQHTGRTDIPLTAHGEEEAKALKSYLKDIPFQKVFTSPLTRALKTCELAGYKEEAIICNDLLEWDYGDYEGLTTSQIREKVKNWNLFSDGVPNGETAEKIGSRADNILQKCTKIEGNVALFGSGHINRVIGARWINLLPTEAKFLALSTASVSILSYEHEWKVIQCWNDTSHLKHLIN